MNLLKKKIHIWKALQLLRFGHLHRNRLFRILGMTKAGQQHYLKSELDFTFENWKSIKICPMDTNGIELIEAWKSMFYTIFAVDLVLVRQQLWWMGSKCVTGEICKYLSDTVGKIQRMIYTGKTCELFYNTLQEFILVKRVINRTIYTMYLINKTYHIKCHSNIVIKREAKRYISTQD